MSKTEKQLNNIYSEVREKYKRVIIDLLRGDCNDIAKAYLLGMKESYNDILNFIKNNYLTEKPH